ncbi:MAG: FCD domain-containing protein [Clostridia bacterium]
MKKNLTDEFIEKLEYRILMGEYKVGQRLPTLRELATTNGVSRSVVNAAIIELANIGYIKIVPTKWIEVADWEREGSLAILNGIVEFDLMDKKIIGSLLDSRKLIEIECVKLASLKAKKQDILKLQAIVNEENIYISIEDRVCIDMKFHHMISVMSGNFVYPLIMKSFEKNSYKLIHEFYSKDNIYEFVMKTHKEILEAISSGDVDTACNSMLNLLIHGEKILFEKIGG